MSPRTRSTIAGLLIAVVSGWGLAGPLKLHPTQLYEFAAALTIAAVAAVALRRHWRSGAVAAFSWSCFFSWRLINDGLRAPATLELPWTIAIHVTAVLAGLWILRQRFAPEGATSPCDA